MAPVIPPEILDLIFANLTSPTDFYALCLVSRYFYGTAIRYLYRRITVPKQCHSHDVFTAPLQALLTSAQQRELTPPRKPKDARKNPYRDLSDCGEFVRHFKFDIRNIKGSVTPGAGAILEAAVENMTRLESFIWQTSPTTSILDLPRTPRLSRALAAKPTLKHLTLERIFADIDGPLLTLPPLTSFSFVLESNFASFAHRQPPLLRPPNPAASPSGDYDIIRQILQTSSKTLTSLSLRSTSAIHPQYNDESLLFSSPLENLTSLSISGRLFTSTGVSILTDSIPFAALHTLSITSCVQAEKLLCALRPLTLQLQRLTVQCSQVPLAGFLAAFVGLRELRIWVEGESDWTAPGGARRHVSTGEVTDGLVDGVVRHGATLEVVSVCGGRKVWFGVGALGRMLRGCGVLREVVGCVGFGDWVGVVGAVGCGVSLRRVQLQCREVRLPVPEGVDGRVYYDPRTTREERGEMCKGWYAKALLEGGLEEVEIWDEEGGVRRVREGKSVG